MTSLSRCVVKGFLSAGMLALALPAMAVEQGDLLLRVGVASLHPDDSSSAFTTRTAAALPGTAVQLNHDTKLSLEVVYMLSNSIGLEVTTAIPFEHDLSVRGLRAYGLKGSDLGSFRQLPVTLSALYYFGPVGAALRPYAGLGLNYTSYFNESLSRGVRTDLAARRLQLEDSVGLSANVGFDWELSPRWLANGSLRRIDMDTKASLQSSLGGLKSKVNLDPYVYSIAVAYKF